MSVFWLVFGYLAGSCPTGYLAVKMLKGQDIRDYGSGNIGATNTGRVLGKKWAVAVAVFDMLKGGIAVLLASFFTDNDVILALTGVFAVLGHNYPVWLGWRGGKGVATTFGVLAFMISSIPARPDRRGCMVCRDEDDEICMRGLHRCPLRFSLAHASFHAASLLYCRTLSCRSFDLAA